MQARSQGLPSAANTRDCLPSFPVLLVLAGLLRVLLICYGVFHDARQALKYTDVDYYVFSDASSFLLRPQSIAAGAYGQHLARQGYIIGSPYDRATYRYTPLLAILLLPNSLVHPLFGKYLFAAADLVIGYLLYITLTQHQGVSPARAKLSVSLVWLLNPIVANISTRGSAESVLGVLVVGSLVAANSGRWRTAAIVFGMAVHFKLYPVIYAAPFMAKLSRPGSLVNRKQLFFAAYAFATFAGINRVMHIV
jgi:phosphatidylinositol glycan class M